MTPFDQDRDVKVWKSKFHGAVMKVNIGQDTS